MPLEAARHAVGSRTLIRVRMLDRRLARPALEDWLFQHDVEQCLYGANNGALYQLYGRCGKVCLRPPSPISVWFVKAVTYSRRSSCAVQVLAPVRTARSEEGLHPHPGDGGGV